MPLASPDTTVTSQLARRKPSVAAKSRPGPVAFLVPTIPTRRASSADQSPRQNSTAGGCGSVRSTAGYSGSSRVTAPMPWRAQRSAQSPIDLRWADRDHADVRSLVSMGATAGCGCARPAATAIASTGSWWASSTPSRAVVASSNPASAANAPVRSIALIRRPTRLRSAPTPRRVPTSAAAGPVRRRPRRSPRRRRRRGRRWSAPPCAHGGSRAR